MVTLVFVLGILIPRLVPCISLLISSISRAYCSTDRTPPPPLSYAVLDMDFPCGSKFCLDSCSQVFVELFYHCPHLGIYSSFVHHIHDGINPCFVICFRDVQERGVYWLFLCPGCIDCLFEDQQVVRCGPALLASCLGISHIRH